MPTARVRVGVVGAGSWAVSTLLPLLAARDDVELVTAVRPGRAQLAELQRRFALPHVSEDLDEALGLGLDAAVVASPPAWHHEHVRAALEAGAHVLCEKPFTVEPEHAWDLVRLAERRERHLVLSFGWNYRPAAVEACRLLARHGGVGRLEHLLVALASPVRELLAGTGSYRSASPDFPPETATWTDPRVSGGGYAPAQLSHALALALWLTGERVAQVVALANRLGGPVDVHDAVALRLGSGAVGSVSGASCHAGACALDLPGEPWPRQQLQVRLVGDAGQLVLDLERDFLWLYRDGGAVDERVPLPPEAGRYRPDGPLAALVDLAAGREVANRSPGELGARTVEAVAAVTASASAGRLVTVTEPRENREPSQPREPREPREEPVRPWRRGCG